MNSSAIISRIARAFMRLTINHIEEDFIFVISVVKLTFTTLVSDGHFHRDL